MPDHQRPTRSFWLTIGGFLVALLAAYTAFQYSPAQRQSSVATSTIFHSRSPSFDMESLIQSGQSLLPTQRSEIGQSGARLACWPSTGGIWITQAAKADLFFLHLSQNQDVARPWPPIKAYSWSGVYFDGPEGKATHPSAIEEDLFCERLRMIGAQFWNHSNVLKPLTEPLESTVTPTVRGDLGLAWSAGGGPAAMINLTSHQRTSPEQVKAFKTADSMAERFRIIKRLNGTDCSVQFDTCKTLWCNQYTSFCYESSWLWEWATANHRWAEYMDNRYPLQGEELASYASDQWIRDERTNNFYWRYAKDGH